MLPWSNKVPEVVRSWFVSWPNGSKVWLVKCG